MRPYIVRQGDHLTRIAFAEGFDVEAVWNHARNAGLRDAERTPDLLAPGDVLFIPEREPGGVPVTLQGDNAFQAQVPLVKVRLQLCVGGEPVANRDFEAICGGLTVKGASDGDGNVDLDVPVVVRECELRLPAEDLVLTVSVGGLDPTVERSGSLQRLANLGYLPPAAWEDTAEVARGVRLFQENHGIDVTGVLDEATRKALAREHAV